MEMNLPPYMLLLVLAVLLGVAGAVYKALDERRETRERGEEYGRIAASRGWRFAHKDPQARRELGLPWGWGNHWQRNFTRGELEGTGFIVYDDIVKPKNQTQILRCFAAFHMGAEFPRFRIYPNNWMTLLNLSLTWSKVQFPEDPAFGEAYRMEAPDKEAAHAACQPRIRSLLLQNPGWSLESKSGWLRLTDGARDRPATTVEDFLSRTWELAKLFRDR